MQKLLRKTVNVFLRYPILWLPYICAYLLQNCLGWLRSLARKEILAWGMTGYSVFGGPGIPFSNASGTVNAIRLNQVLECGVDYIYAWIWAMALVVTAILVAMIFRSEPLAWRNVAVAARGYLKRALGYSAKLWVLSMALMALASVSAIFLTMPTANRPASLTLLYTEIKIVVGIFCYGWIMAPLSIRLLRPVDAQPVTAVEKQLGRYSIICAAIAAHVLGALLHPALQALAQTSKIAQTLEVDLIHPVLSFPTLLALIAIGLIAIGSEPLVDNSTPRVDVRKYLRALMPQE